jgi:2-polyprenyl-3-methyl-5-hydroxy-6-metoxy-1,4-benzoquinol methylase
VESSRVAPSPRTAVIWTALRAELGRPDRTGAPPLRVLDVGGGTGGFAVPLAQAGHHVTVVDASPDALASLARRAADADVAARVRGVQGDGDQLASLVPPASVDIVLCHSVLEEVDDPAAVLAAVATALRPGGVASIVVANRRGAVLARALAGHLAAATALLRDAEATGGARGPTRRFDAESAAALVTAAGLTVETVSGVRVIADLLPGALADADAAGLLDFELAAAHQPAFRDIATQLHVLARRG